MEYLHQKTLNAISSNKPSIEDVGRVHKQHPTNIISSLLYSKIYKGRMNKYKTNTATPT